jgi:hypothetical protein
MDKSILDKLTPDDLPALQPSHPDDAEFVAATSGLTPEASLVVPESVPGRDPVSEPPCAN